MDKPKHLFAVAIDGTAASGKSTVAKLLAESLSCSYLDTGKLYRAIALELMRRSSKAPQSWSADIEHIREALDRSGLRIEAPEVGECRVFLGDTDVNDLLCELEVEQATPFAARIPEVRSHLLDVQRDLPKRTSVIMAGRDIGTVVLPHADLKVFIEADLQERAKRRLSQHKANFTQAELQKASEDLKARDHKDSTRECAPMICDKGALKLDSTQQTPEQLVCQIKTALLSNLESQPQEAN